MALYLPRSLARLSRLATKDNPRYALAGVHVLDKDDGTYQISATDGRVLLVARGVNEAPSPHKYGGDEVGYPEIEDAPSGVLSAVIPIDDWDRAFKLPGKTNKIGLAMGQHNQGVAGSKTRITMGVPGQIITCWEVEGRYPPVTEVFPKSGPVFSMTVDPELYAKLMSVIGGMLPREGRQVKLHFWKKTNVLGATARSEDGFYDAAVMPLTDGKDEKEERKELLKRREAIRLAREEAAVKEFHELLDQELPETLEDRVSISAVALEDDPEEEEPEEEEDLDDETVDL